MNTAPLEGYEVSGATGPVAAAWPPAAARIGAGILKTGGNGWAAAV